LSSNVDDDVDGDDDDVGGAGVGSMSDFIRPNLGCAGADDLDLSLVLGSGLEFGLMGDAFFSWLALVVVVAHRLLCIEAYVSKSGWTSSRRCFFAGGGASSARSVDALWDASATSKFGSSASALSMPTGLSGLSN
jgi:hypothetical protein